MRGPIRATKRGGKAVPVPPLEQATIRRLARQGLNDEQIAARMGYASPYQVRFVLNSVEPPRPLIADWVEWVYRQHGYQVFRPASYISDPEFWGVVQDSGALVWEDQEAGTARLNPTVARLYVRREKE